ncbi:hypothetical protein CRG98_041955, partial [Punica granatum]
DEWVISRVFQKAGAAASGCGAGVACDGSSGKKARIPAHFLYAEASSASNSLPPLLDSSPYPALNDGRDSSCSYVDSSTPKEHVSCFSIISSAGFNGSSRLGGGGFFQLAPPIPALPRHGNINTSGTNSGVPANFPSLRSLQENLQLPASYFLPPIQSIGLGELGGCSSSGSWSGQDNNKLEGGSGGGGRMGVGASELDCMWSY